MGINYKWEILSNKENRYYADSAIIANMVEYDNDIRVEYTESGKAFTETYGKENYKKFRFIPEKLHIKTSPTIYSNLNNKVDITYKNKDFSIAGDFDTAVFFPDTGKLELDKHYVVTSVMYLLPKSDIVWVSYDWLRDKGTVIYTDHRIDNFTFDNVLDQYEYQEYRIKTYNRYKFIYNSHNVLMQVNDTSNEDICVSHKSICYDMSDIFTFTAQYNLPILQTSEGLLFNQEVTETSSYDNGSLLEFTRTTDIIK